MDEMNWDAGSGRISADDNVEAAGSLEAQEKACLAFAQEMGFMAPVCVYQERGSESDRPEFARLMQAAREGQIDCVVMYDFGLPTVEPGQPEGHSWT